MAYYFHIISYAPGLLLSQWHMVEPIEPCFCCLTTVPSSVFPSSVANSLMVEELYQLLCNLSGFKNATNQLAVAPDTPTPNHYTKTENKYFKTLFKPLFLYIVFSRTTFSFFSLSVKIFFFWVFPFLKAPGISSPMKKGCRALI